MMQELYNTLIQDSLEFKGFAGRSIFLIQRPVKNTQLMPLLNQCRTTAPKNLDLYANEKEGNYDLVCTDLNMFLINQQLFALLPIAVDARYLLSQDRADRIAMLEGWLVTTPECHPTNPGGLGKHQAYLPSSAVFLDSRDDAYAALVEELIVLSKAYGNLRKWCVSQETTIKRITAANKGTQQSFEKEEDKIIMYRNVLSPSAVRFTRLTQEHQRFVDKYEKCVKELRQLRKRDVFHFNID